VLASASPARRRLLVDAGFDPTVIVSGVDEESIEIEDGFELVATLAEMKARKVAASEGLGDAIVLGCDSMFLLDGEVLGKPLSEEEAISRWKRMRGRTGVLLTGHCVVDVESGRVAQEVGDTLVRFADVSDDEIAAYVATGEPLHVAGGFTQDGRSGIFIEGLDGDSTNVVGLSLPLLRRLLLELGIEVTSLWR
jgi:septum formation protein